MFVKSGQSVSLKAWVRSDVHHGRDAAGGDRAVGRDHGERVREEREADGVVEVRVADQRVLDLDLLGHRERAPDGSGVDQDAVVDEEGRRPLALTFTAIGPKDLEPHSTLACLL